MRPLLKPHTFHWNLCKLNMFIVGEKKIEFLYLSQQADFFNNTNYTITWGGEGERRGERQGEEVRHNWRAWTVGLRYDSHYRDGSSGQVKDREVIHSGTWPHIHTHLPSRIGNSNSWVTHGNKRREEGCKFNNVIFTTDKYSDYSCETLFTLAEHSVLSKNS